LLFGIAFIENAGSAFPIFESKKIEKRQALYSYSFIFEKQKLKMQW